MRVIADLHGGDYNNPIAIAEYEEIKNKVREDVSDSSSDSATANYIVHISANLVTIGLMP